MAKYSRNQNYQQEEVSRPGKKMSRGVLILFIILGVFIIPAASFVTGKLLLAMSQDLGRPKTAAVKAASDMDILLSF